jgi:hypothetical protein
MVGVRCAIVNTLHKSDYKYSNKATYIDSNGWGECIYIYRKEIIIVNNIIIVKAKVD